MKKDDGAIKTKDSNNTYDPQKISLKWQEKWKREKLYQIDLDSDNGSSDSLQVGSAPKEKPYYTLMMFPYPSAEGLHIGGIYTFTGVDAFVRFKRMQGYDVFEPFGLDAFGIHSENYALKIGTHPMKQAAITQENFYRQMQATGSAIDWSKKLETNDPNYYKWTQWLFIQLFKHGLAERKKAKVNFCPSCKTVLADEQVLQESRVKNQELRTEVRVGVCERCGTEVEKRDLEQWFFKITKYADRLLNNIEGLDWAQKVKTAQTNWIGRSEGALIKFSISNFQFPLNYQDKNFQNYIEVFTTRPDTIYGATFLVAGPDSKIIENILKQVQDDNLNKELKEYINMAQNKSEQERLEEGKEKTGVFTGLYATHPMTGEQLPIWIADYVLGSYGTGAIMAVPAHDERDYAFAKKHNLPIRPVVIKENVFAKSYVMGGERISDADLSCLGITIEKKLTDRRYIKIPLESFEKYEQLIIEKLEQGFWNEYIGPMGVVFIFKFKDGKTERILLNLETEKRVEDLIAQFSCRSAAEKSNILGLLAENEWYKDELIHNETGFVVNSDKWDDYVVPHAMGRIIQDLEKDGIGIRKSTYHLRDWLISRQRYWGPPIPMIYCEKCAKVGKSWFTSAEAEEYSVLSSKYYGEEKNKKHNTKYIIPNTAVGWYPVSEMELPVLLPYIDDFKPLGTGKAPLANHPEFYETVCPECGSKARRETDVSDTFLDSSWYFLRYLATDWDDVAFPSEKIAKSKKQRAKNEKEIENWNLKIENSQKRSRFLPVTIYIGGAEHSVLHLLYARFMTMFLYDCGYLDFEEPFSKFYAHGLIIKDGAKMSKSKGNVILPDPLIQKFGIDTVRLYLRFLGPFDQDGDFRDTGIEGMHRFVKRVWVLFTQNKIENGQLIIDNLEAKKIMHETIKGVTEDMEALRFNTAIAKLMTWYNFLSQQKQISYEEEKVYLQLLAPFAPHITEELYAMLNDQSPMTNENWMSIHTSKWPEFDEKALVSDEVTIVVQVNGRVRGSVQMENGKWKMENSKKDMEKIAIEDERVRKYLEGKNIIKTIYVPGKVINFVTDSR